MHPTLCTKACKPTACTLVHVCCRGALRSCDCLSSCWRSGLSIPKRFQPCRPSHHSWNPLTRPLYVSAAHYAGDIEQVLSVAEHQDDVYVHLAARVAAEAHASPVDRRIIVGIVGVPGSGKSTTAEAVCHLINERLPGPECQAVVVSMDGFHFFRSQLDSGVAGDPEQAHSRRGAHWTFDAEAFVHCVRKLREASVTAGSWGSAGVAVPTFAHGIGDPVPGGVIVMPHHKIVLIEGNYLLLDQAPWSDVLPLLDDSWFIDCPLGEAMRRVTERHISLGKDFEAACTRVAMNDRPNAELIDETRHKASLIVPSLPLMEA